MNEMIDSIFSLILGSVMTLLFLFFGIQLILWIRLHRREEERVMMLQTIDDLAERLVRVYPAADRKTEQVKILLKSHLSYEMKKRLEKYYANMDRLIELRIRNECMKRKNPE